MLLFFVWALINSNFLVFCWGGQEDEDGKEEKEQ